MRRLELVLLGLGLVLAACGDDGSRHIDDASPPNDDRPAPDMADAPVTVTVTRDGTPVAGATVYFQNADSSLVATVATDVTGNASTVMAAGGFATLVNPYTTATFGISDALYTWQGVKPGDHLLFHQDTTLGAQMRVTIPTDDTASFYEITGSCPNSSTEIAQPVGGVPQTLQVSMSFFGCDTADVMVVAVDANRDPLSSFMIPAQTIADQGVLDLSAQTYTTAIARTYTYNNYADANDLEIRDRVASTRGVVFVHEPLLAAGDPAVVTGHMPALFANQLDVVAARQPQVGLTERDVVEWGNAGYTTDFASHLLPDFASDPAYDLATHAVAWTTTGGAVTPDLAEVVMFNGHGGRSWQWQVVSPGGSTVTFPVVPTDIFDYNAGAADVPNIVGVGTASVPGGYDAVRGAILSLQGDPGDFAGGSAAGVISFNQYNAQIAVRLVPLRELRLWAGPRR
jgi:hypothetical protein